MNTMHPMSLFEATRKGSLLTNYQLAASLIKGDMLWLEYVDTVDNLWNYDGPVTVEITDDAFGYLLCTVNATRRHDAGRGVFKWSPEELTDPRDSYDDDLAEGNSSEWRYKVYAAELA
jgi:hypothetical protein